MQFNTLYSTIDTQFTSSKEVKSDLTREEMYTYINKSGKKKKEIVEM